MAPLKIVSVDLAAGPRALGGLHGYDAACVVLRWGRRVLGRARVPVRDGSSTGDGARGARCPPVSYTHLTLPTILLV